MGLDVTQLSLEDNCIVVLKTDDPMPDLRGLTGALGATMEARGYTGGWIIAIGPDEDLTVLDDEELDRMGLQRKEPEVPK